MRVLLLFTYLLLGNSALFGQDTTSIKKELASWGENIPTHLKEIQAKAPSLIQHSRKLHYYHGVYFGYKHLGTSFLYLGKMDSAKISFEAALQVEKKTSIELKEKAALRNNLALAHQKLGDMERSYSCYSESFVISTQLGDSLGIARSSFNIGTYFRSKGDFKSAISYFDTSLKIYGKLKDQHSVSQVLNSLGLIQKSLKNYSKAIDLFEECLTIRTSLNDRKGIMDVENNIAATYIDQGNYESAKKHQTTSLNLAIALKNNAILAGSYANLGIIHKELGENEAALTNYSNALELFELLNDSQGILTTCTNLGLLHIEEAQWKLAESNLLKAKEYAKSIQSIESIIKINRGLSDLYSKTGQFEFAFQNYVELDRLSDSLFSLASAKQLAEVQEKYETEKKNKEIQTLQSKVEIDAKNSQIKSQKIQLLIIVVVASILVGLFLIGWIIYRKKLHEKEKEQLTLKESMAKHELALKNRKLASFATETLHKNQFIDDLNGLFEKITSTHEISDENMNAYKSLLHSNRQEQNNWDTFKVHFENVHPKFFKELERAYPRLTQNDFRICAYIKMDLNNKEIASLMNIAPSSVKMSKNRIKKKMELSEQEDLSQVIKEV